MNSGAFSTGFIYYSNQKTPLHLAAVEGHVDTVKYLVNKGVDINIKDINGVSTPLVINYYSWCLG